MRSLPFSKSFFKVFWQKTLTNISFSGIILGVVSNIAGVAQSVVQLIRNQQVVCSSHITSSIRHSFLWRIFF